MRASSQAAWVRAVEAHPAFATLRVDAHANLMAIAWVLARSAGWTSLTTRPTWTRVMQQAGIGRSTVAKDVRMLRDAGLLGVVETGSTPLIRTGVLYGLASEGTGNRAAEYVLCVPRPDPPVDVSRTPSGFRQEAIHTPLHAREDAPANESLRPLAAPPRSRGEMLAAAGDLQRGSPLLARITARHLRRVLVSLSASDSTYDRAGIFGVDG